MRLITVTLLCATLVCAAPDWVLIRTTEGTTIEAQTNLTALKQRSISSFHSGAPLTEKEKARVTAGIIEIQGKDRKARDIAVEELTAIGVPVVTPLLEAYKDTDQHEPRPLYRLFERVMPSHADGFDRTLSVVRLDDGKALRVPVPEGSLELKKADGSKTALPWASVRTLAVRKKLIRTMPVHSLRHCNQIEYLDTGVVLTPTSKADFTADGFVRMSWHQDGWASDANGLSKPGSPAYKTHLVNGHPFGALIGRIGATGETFFIGKKSAKTGLPPGRLTIAVNDNPHWQNNVGTFTVTLTATDVYDLGDPQ